MDSATRLNKFLSQIGYCSRRAADQLIEAGRVTVNGEPALMGQKVSAKDAVWVDGKSIAKPPTKPVYLAFNKPKGIVCTTNARVEKNNIVDYINYPTRIFPVGRLDKNSEGLILLTNDGELTNQILKARNHNEKEYKVVVDRPITKEFIEKMENGIPILDTVTRKCKVKQTHKKEFGIILTQGLNRQIRRMCEYLGYRVVSLKRVRIMHIPLDVKTGEYRLLSAKEVQGFLRKN